MSAEHARPDVPPHFVPGGFRGRLRCELCGISPGNPWAHTQTADHRLQVHVLEVRARGWVPVGAAHHVIRRRSGVPWKQAAMSVKALSVGEKYKGTDEDFNLGTWAPAWAVEIGVNAPPAAALA